MFVYYLDTHALVNFDTENCSSIVPLKRVERQDGLCDGDPCKVTWSNSKKYNATIICSGIRFIKSIGPRGNLLFVMVLRI